MSTNTAALESGLKTLQADATKVATQIRSTNREFYGHLAEVYIWWRKASEVDGYLDAEYKKVVERYKKVVNHGINFAPLFWLVWGHNNNLSDDKAGRYSRVINELHKAYETEDQYKTDSVAKLTAFITVNGGVDGLGYGKKDKSTSPSGGADKGVGEVDEAALGDEALDDDEWQVLAQKPEANSVLSRAAIFDRLYADAEAFYRTAPSLKRLAIDAALPLTGDDLSIVLIRKSGAGYELIGASPDKEIAQQLSIESYLRDFSALPPSIRAIAEVISTQCLPARLQPMYDSLLDPPSKGKAVKGNMAVRRLLYRQRDGAFILSPIRAGTGVVTTAKPIANPFASVASDVFLSTRARRALELYMIADRWAALYNPEQSDVIPAPSDFTLGSHNLVLRHKCSETVRLNIDFWPFESNPANAKVLEDQLAAKPFKKSPATFTATLDLAWFQHLSADLIRPWVEHYGKYAKRETQKIMRLAFSPTILNAEWVYRDGIFEVNQSIPMPDGKATGASFAIFVRTKDFIVAMNAVADLNVVGAVQLNASASVLRISFSTAAASYEIAIPTCDEDAKCSPRAFEAYSPQLTQPDPLDAVNDQQEGDFNDEQGALA